MATVASTTSGNGTVIPEDRSFARLSPTLSQMLSGIETCPKQFRIASSAARSAGLRAMQDLSPGHATNGTGKRLEMRGEACVFTAEVVKKHASVYQDHGSRSRASRM